MSAIAGIWYPSAAQPVQGSVGRMLERLAYQGPDGEGIWSEDGVGLGHRALHSTPESLHERQPLVSGAGRLAITADLRIDNRRELIDALGFAGGPEREIPDSELVLAAYERWDEMCVEKLLGDFSFAIWDGRRRQLFCARDHFGVKPFFYHRSGRLFAFATDIEAILAIPEVPRRLNETRVGDYLVSFFQDTEITFFEEILRLPPAHTLTVRPGEMQKRRYWALDPSREVRRSSDAEYAEEFREIFTEAVRCRLRSAFPVGSMLSGGLDSSSVVSVARNLLAQDGHAPLHTFSALFEGIPEGDERTYIELVASQGGIVPHYLPAHTVSPFADLESAQPHEPTNRPNLVLQRSIYAKANEHGVRVVLDGLGGDSVVSHGFGFLSELARDANWEEFGMQVEGLANQLQRERRETARTFLTPYLSGLKDRRQWGKLLNAFVQVPWHTRYPAGRFYLDYCLMPIARRLRRHLLAPLRGGRRNGSAAADRSLVNRRFAERISLRERQSRWRKAAVNGVPSQRWGHYLALNAGGAPLTLEVFGAAAAACQVEPRYPHFDRRLAEFCLGLPPEQKLWRGWTRVVARRAMEQILPSQIQWRGGKADLWVPFHKTLRQYGQAALEEAIQRPPAEAEKYIEWPVLRERYQRYLSGDDSEATPVWIAASLIRWLRESGMASGNSPAPGDAEAVLTGDLPVGGGRSA